MHFSRFGHPSALAGAATLFFGLSFSTAASGAPAPPPEAAEGSLDERDAWRPAFRRGDGSPHRRLVGDRNRFFQLDLARLRQRLLAAPLEFTAAVAEHPLVVALPDPVGRFHRFVIEDSPVLPPTLAARYPQIRTFRLRGADDRLLAGRITVSDFGIDGAISSPDGTWLLEAWNRSDPSLTIVFRRNDDHAADDVAWTCETDALPPPGAELRSRIASPGSVPAEPRWSLGQTRRVYTLAVATTGEYGTWAGSLVGAMALITASVNRVNSIFDRDLSIFLVLHSANDDVMYFDPLTDPYSGAADNTVLIEQNQTTLEAVLGLSTFDVGHLFHVPPGGGTAGQGQFYGPCDGNVGGNKARGITGSQNPTGDTFNVDYVAHEIGHQFGGFHTFNAIGAGSCVVLARSEVAAKEPGGGTTVMAYAGICPPSDVQANTSDYFHVDSIDRIISFARGGGNSCPVKTTPSNLVPTVGAGPDRWIPSQTPFLLGLEATSSDGDSDPLTFCWEQNDAGAASPPDTDDGTRAILRSFPPAASEIRYFPQPFDLQTGTSTYGESLPTTTRDLKFQFSARDGNGGFVTDAVVVHVRGDRGPFRVTSPTSATVWNGGASQTVTWNVAGTATAPISCAAVDLSLSGSGGANFEHLIAASVPNTGSWTGTFPAVSTANGSVRVRCVDNIFFHQSIQGLQVRAVDLTLSGTDPADGTVWTNSLSWSFTVSNLVGLNVTDDDADSVVLQVVFPAGFVPDVSFPCVATGSTVNCPFLTMAFGESRTATMTATAPGPGSFTVTASATSSTGETDPSDNSVSLPVTLACAPPPVPVLLAPANGEDVCDESPRLDWSGTAVSYDVFVDSVLVCDDVTESECSPTLSLGSHLWFVEARSSCGSTTNSAESRYIDVVAQNLQPPVLTGPATSTVFCSPATPLLTWTGNGQTYDVWVNGVFVCEGTTLTSCSVAMTPGQKDWLVVARNDCGAQEMSAEWRTLFVSGTPQGSIGTASDLDPAAGTGVTVGWTVPADWRDYGASVTSRGYRVHRNGAPLSGWLSPPATSFVDTTGDENRGYLYDVEVRNACGDSTFAGPNASVADGVARFVGHYIADDLATIGWDGDPVSTWSDLSGAGNTASQATSSRFPTLIEGDFGPNGTAAVRFDGVDDQLVLPPVLSSDFTIAVVFRGLASDPAAVNWWQAAGLVDAETSGVVDDFGLAFNGRIIGGTGNPDTSVRSGAACGDDAPHVAVMTRRMESGIVTLFVDGIQVAQGSAGTQLLASPSRITIGSLQINTGYFRGDIAEIRLYEGVLAPTPLASLHSQLLSTYQTARQGRAEDAFSTDYNPYGGWGWGSKTSIDSDSYERFGSSTPNGVPNAVDFWHHAVGSPFGDGNAYRNKTTTNQSSASIVIPPDLMGMNPAASGRASAARWVAADAGPVRIAGRFQAMDAASTAVAVSKNDVPVWTANVDGAAGTAAFDLELTAGVSDRFDFTVTNRGSSTGDATGLDATIAAATPAPACAWLQSGVLGLWRGEDLLDSIGGNHGAFAPGGGRVWRGKVADAFELDGFDDYVTVPDAPALRPTTALSIGGWVQFHTAPGGIRQLLGKANSASGNSYALWLQNGALQGATMTTGGSYVVSQFPWSPVVGTWYHLVFTWDLATSKQRIYIDGTKVAENTSTVVPGYTSQPILIGADLENGVPSFFAPARFDDVFLFGRAVAESELRAMVRAGRSGFCSTTACLAPVGATSTARDADPFAWSGNVVEWTPPSSWGDDGTNLPSRTTYVLRNGVAISGSLGTGVTSFLDAAATAGVAYAYQVRFVNSCGGSTDTPSISATDEKATLDTRLRADDLVASLADGAAIASWTDASGSGNHATQGTASRRPILVTNDFGPNGRAAVRFDGVDDQLVLPPVVTGDFTIVVVFRSVTGNTAYSQWYGAPGLVDAEVSGGANDFGMSFNGRILAGTGSPDVTLTSSPAYQDGVPHIATMTRRRASGLLTLWIDGVQVHEVTGGTQLLDSPTRITLGSLQTDLGWFRGDLAEVRIYDGALTDLTLGGIHAELLATYQSARRQRAEDAFTLAANPAGGWTWGSKSSSTAASLSTFGLTTTAGSGITSWWHGASSPDGDGSVNRKPGSSTYIVGNFYQTPDLLNLHPAASGRPAATRYTVPSTGPLRLAGRFQGLDTTTTDVSIAVDGSIVYSGYVWSSSQPAAFDLELSLSAGQQVDFAVGFGNGNYYSDSTGLEAGIFDPTPTPACASLPSGAAALWRGEDFQDSVGSNDATPVGGALIGRGLVGSAFDFDGVNDHVSIPDAPALRPTTALSIGGWVQFRSSAAGVNILVSKPSNGGYNSYVLFVQDGYLRGTSADAANNYVIIQNPWTPVVGAWYHVCFTYDRSTSLQRLYLDGMKVAENVSTIDTFYSASSLMIGAGIATTTPTYFSPARFDDMFVFARALGELELRNIVRAGRSGFCQAAPCNSPTGTIASWKLDENAGTNASDSVGTHHGALQGGASWTAGRFGSAVSLDGTSGTIRIPHAAALQPGGAMTIAAWIRPVGLTTTQYSEIYRKEGVTDRHLLSFQGFGTLLSFGLSTGGAYAELDVPVSASSFTDGGWHHVAATYDGATKRLFRDGIEIGSAPATGAIGISGSADAWIGSWSGTEEFFQGAIDQAGLFDRALSPGEIATLASQFDGIDTDGDGTGDPCDTDDDGDGVLDPSDCAPLDAGSWSLPANPVSGVSVTGSGTTTFAWPAPAAAGGTVPRYDLLRSSSPGDFAAATCVESDGTDLVATDPALPPAGATWYYLVRVESACGGNLGSDSLGNPRNGVACP